jgi:hypothetical protein
MQTHSEIIENLVKKNIGLEQQITQMQASFDERLIEIERNFQKNQIVSTLVRHHLLTIAKTSGAPAEEIESLQEMVKTYAEKSPLEPTKPPSKQ